MAFPPDHLMRDKHRPCRNTCCIPRDVCRYGNSYSPDVVRWQSLCLWNVSAIDASQQELEQTLFCLRSLQKLAVSRLLLLVAVFCRYLCHIFFIQLFCIGIIAGKAKQPTILLSRRRMWSQTMSSVLQKNTLKSHAQIISLPARTPSDYSKQQTQWYRYCERFEISSTQCQFNGEVGGELRWDGVYVSTAD